MFIRKLLIILCRHQEFYISQIFFLSLSLSIQLFSFCIHDEVQDLNINFFLLRDNKSISEFIIFIPSVSFVSLKSCMD